MINHSYFKCELILRSQRRVNCEFSMIIERGRKFKAYGFNLYVTNFGMLLQIAGYQVDTLTDITILEVLFRSSQVLY